MAYFLDPELVALVEGAKRPTVTPARIMPNKFPKTCDARCGGYVGAGQGRVEKQGGQWRVYHLAC